MNDHQFMALEKVADRAPGARVTGLDEETGAVKVRYPSGVFRHVQQDGKITIR